MTQVYTTTQFRNKLQLKLKTFDKRLIQIDYAIIFAQ